MTTPGVNPEDFSAQGEAFADTDQVTLASRAPEIVMPNDNM